MKKTSILILAGLLFCISSYAQDRNRPDRSPETRAQRSVDRLDEKLSLEDQQKDSLVAIMTDFLTDAQQQRRENQEMMQQAIDARDERVKAVLNEQQFEQFEALIENMKKRADGRRRNGRREDGRREDGRREDGRLGGGQ